MKQKQTKHIGIYIGNALITIALIGLFFTYVPILLLYVTPPQTITIEKNPSNYILDIPKIHAVAPLVLNVNPWDPKEYMEALKKGVAHAKGTVLPGEKGLTYLFAHSSGIPWEITRYNTIFYRLGELQPHDTIVVYHLKKVFRYEITEKKIVWPNDTRYLTDNSQNHLIIQTCTPIGTDLKRLLIFATLQKN